MHKSEIVQKVEHVVPTLSDNALLALKRDVNRQLAYSKISETYNHDPITAFKVAEVLQREHIRRMGD
jgi:hypothetical protein